MNTVWVVLSTGLVMLAWERWYPGQRFRSAAGWLPRAMLLSAVQALIAWAATLTWNRWMPDMALWHAGGRGLILDALLGYFVITFVYYWWHRARHEIPFLWRWLHQVHHSPCRIEVLTSFYKHPAEILVNGVLSSLIVYVLLGLDGASAGLAVVLTGLAELFYHWNVRTPRWLGNFIQRPESHCVHHKRGHHTSNFADLPLWDMLFGTFDNPRVATADCGFSPEAEQRIFAMLVGKSIAASPAPVPETQKPSSTNGTN